MIKLVKIDKKFMTEEGEIAALRDVDFDVATGEFFTLIGPSGCGKSTILRIIAGLVAQSNGRVEWEEEVRMGFVFQSYALFPFLTVKENIEFGLKMQGVGEKERNQVAHELIAEVGLAGFEDKHPKELSGGMKQRVGIARSLAIQPRLLLLDEPFSSLDEFTAEDLRELLLSLWKKRKLTVVMVTHLIREAIEMSGRIAVMTAAPGSIEKILDNPLPRPRDVRSSKFFELEDRLKELIKF